MSGSAMAARQTKPFFGGASRQIGLQLYTLGDEPSKDLDGTLAKVAALGYRDLELPGLYGKTAAVLKAAADKAGVKYSSLHVPAAPLFGAQMLSLADSANQIADVAHGLGLTDIVMPIMLMPQNLTMGAGDTFLTSITRGMAAEGADIWKRTAATLNEKANALKPHGINLGYHNHNIEFARVGDTTGWDVLMAEIDRKLVSLELDLGWVAAGGHDPIRFLSKLKGRVRQVHVKDIKSTTRTNVSLQMDPTQVGDGALDWARTLAAAHKAGVRNFYVEQEPPFTIDRFEAIKRSYDYLAKVKG